MRRSEAGDATPHDHHIQVAALWRRRITKQAEAPSMAETWPGPLASNL